MEFTVLGPLSAVRDGVGVRLTGVRQRRLLAALLVHANTVVPVDRLIDILWGADAPASAAHNLHNLVWRLRTALDPAAILTQPPGYLLRVDPETIDAVRFERVVAAGGERRPERLAEALGLWRGRAFAEFADEEFCRYEAIRLEELRLVAVEERFAACLELGRHAELVGEIEAFAAERPLRERPRELLMTALHGAGRQADALAVYQAFSAELADHVALEPSPALRRRHEEILRAEPARSHPGVRVELSELVGRDGALARALATLTDCRMVTLTGVGGVGKTRLASRVAADARAAFPHGVWMCELAPVRDGGLVPEVLATTLGMQEPAGLSVTHGLVEFLRSRRVLLVIDNCEHVLDDAARLIEELARGCPSVSVLATSREPLGIDGEQVIPLRPLEIPPAAERQDLGRFASVALFVDRATAATPSFALTDGNAAAVGEICRRLDGLPLAIELAASRVRSVSVEEIAGWLGDRLRFLRSTLRLREERHSTLGAVVDWSYQLLDPVERSVFDELSVLVGAFTLDAVAAVANSAGIGPAELVDVVTGLVHKSMLVADTDRTPTRYTMLETLRLFGSTRLERGGRAERTRRRHVAYCVELAEASAAGLAGPDEAHWAELVGMALDDLRDVHNWALVHEPATAVRLSAALWRYTSAHGPSEVYVWAERAAAAAGSAADPALATVLAVAAAGAARRGDLAGATAFAERGLRVVPDPDDPLRRYPVWVLARVASFEGRLIDAAGLYAEVGRLGQDVADFHCVAYVLASCALQHAYAGATERAVGLATQAGKLAATTGNPTAIAWTDYALGVAVQDREPGRALAALDRARTVAASSGNTYIPGVALGVSVAILTRHGDPHLAVRLATEVIDYWSHESHWAQQWTAMRHLVTLLTRLGDYEAATVLNGARTASRTAVRAVGADAELLDADLAVLTERLGADRFAAFSAHGATLSDDDAVAFARSALERLNGKGRRPRQEAAAGQTG